MEDAERTMLGGRQLSSSANSRSLEPSRMTSTNSRTKDCQKRGTATEHAERTRPGGRVILKPNAEVLQAMGDAQADRADDTMENLAFKLAEFLTTLLRDMWKFARLRNATEQVNSSAVKDEDVDTVCEDECEDILRGNC